MKFLRFFFITYISILVSLEPSFGAVSHRVDSTEYPFGLLNKTEFNGGICFADQTIQCLFQNKTICETIKNLNGISSICSQLYKLKTKDQCICSAHRGIPCAWNFIQDLWGKYSFGQSDFAFFLSLMSELFKEVQGLGPRFYSYYEHNQKLQGFDKTCYEASFNIQDEGYVAWSIPNLYKPLHQYNTNEQQSNIGLDANIIVVPGLNLIALEINNQISEQALVTLETRIGDLFERLWHHATGRQCKINIRLKGVTASMKTTSNEKHLVAYVKHQDQWILCSDDILIKPVGTTLQNVAHDIYNTLCGRLNQSFEIIPGSNIYTTTRTTFTSAKPSTLYYEIEELTTPSDKVVTISYAQQHSSSSSSTYHPSPQQRTDTITINNITDLGQLQHVHPNITDTMIEELTSILIAKNYIDPYSGGISPQGGVEIGTWLVHIMHNRSSSSSSTTTPSTPVAPVEKQKQPAESNLSNNQDLIMGLVDGIRKIGDCNDLEFYEFKNNQNVVTLKKELYSKFMVNPDGSLKQEAQQFIINWLTQNLIIR